MSSELHALLPIYDRDITLVKGKGSRLWDKDGREWLDFAAGIAVNGFGYGDRKIVAAIKKQAETLIHASNLFHTEPGSALAERLVRLAFPSKVFFTNSGTEAWEGAMKFARRIGKEQGRTEYVCFEHAFHGRSDGRALDHLDRQVPRALRAARARRALRPAERPRGGGRGRGREDRGGDDRAGAGRGRHPARDAGVPEGPRGDLPGAGRAPRLRRDPVRPRPHREDVRVPALGRRAGHPHPGQAPRRRPAHGRGPAARSRSRAPSRSATTARPSAATPSAPRRRSPSSTTSRSPASSTTSARAASTSCAASRSWRRKHKGRDRRGPRPRAS